MLWYVKLPKTSWSGEDESSDACYPALSNLMLATFSSTARDYSHLFHSDSIEPIASEFRYFSTLMSPRWKFLRDTNQYIAEQYIAAIYWYCQYQYQYWFYKNCNININIEKLLAIYCQYIARNWQYIAHFLFDEKISW